MQKITIFGAGRVGETSALMLAQKGLCREISLFDLRAKAAAGAALDIMQSASYFGFDGVAIVGAEYPIGVMDALLPRLSVDERREFSFTTGLSPAVRRPFHAHFLRSLDAALQRTLDSQNIVCVQA